MPTIEPVPLEDLDPAVQATLERAVADGRLASSLYPRIVAYSSAQVRGVAAGFEHDRQSLLTPRLRELIRIRSAQIAGCAECQAARYDETVDDETAACLLIGTSGDLDDAEQLVMRFVTLFHTDHRAIDGEFYRDLAAHFSTGEIVEIGVLTGALLGSHRFIQTLDLLGSAKPALSYDPSEVDTIRVRLSPSVP